ncbi:29728_t:CDS:2 [Gigaspora margarita]|uniref:29728_t:CDS:1 n=1 Tax=Gigaspora margarita TaxID=4874 RepID=A0ABN7WAT7_GIGMA|nr:29728_t:CDS:2 [Gigaspora margarita]
MRWFVKKIADLGISKPINEHQIGLQSMELLRNKWLQAIFQSEHDEYLILDILNDLRPKISIKISQKLVGLMEKC